MVLELITLVAATAILAFHVLLLFGLMALLDIRIPLRLDLHFLRIAKGFAVAPVLAGLDLALGFYVPHADAAGFVFCGLGAFLFLAPRIIAWGCPQHIACLARKSG